MGTFDGKTFRKESGPHAADEGENFYAAQTYSDIPAADGRRVQIAWMRGGKYPRMPFNQQMSFPCELTLRTFPEGIRLCRTPVREVEKLYRQTQHWQKLVLRPGDNPLRKIEGELFDIRADLVPGHAAEVVLKVRGEPIRYEARTQTIHCRGKQARLVPDKQGAVASVCSI